MRKTKILATLGPACDNVETLKTMIQMGMSAARINFSHGSHESNGATANRLKQAREALNAPVPLVLDTKGPEIRIGTFGEDKILLEQGAMFTLTTEGHGTFEGDVNRVSVSYKDLAKDLKAGDRVLIDDGLIELKVESLTATDVQCRVINSGYISSRKGVNVPDVSINLPSLTEQDEKDIIFGVENGFDFIAASFIRNANDILNIREVLEQHGGEHLKIIAKIESRDGVNNIESILEVADGIMVARGDLGVEIPPEEVPMVQKHLIKMANMTGRLVITATQMLESMTQNPRPTRAEANDVANAIYDGTDAVMLSGETARGLYAVETVAMMARIAEQTESAKSYFNYSQERGISRNITNAISHAACTTARDLHAACIVAVTDSGFAANMVARFRPETPILAITTSEGVCRQLNLSWGCKPMLTHDISGNDEVFEVVEEIAIQSGLAKTGDAIVALAGVPIGIAGTTNTLKVRTVGNVLTKGRVVGKGKIHGIARVFKVAEGNEHFFERGDILVCTETSDDLLDFIKKAGALVIGSWGKIDTSHAETVAKALDIPLLIANEKVVDLIGEGIPLTVDCEQGFVFNGYR